MAAGKVFAISFAINAALGGGFSAAMSGGAAAMRRLKNETTQIKNEQRQLDAAWRASQASIAAYRARVSSLTAQYQAGRISESQFRTGVRIASQAMQSASMSASEYRSNLQRLQGELQRTQAAMQRMQAAQAARASAGARLSGAKAGMLDTVSTAAMVAAPLVGAVETAANFEAAMSKVQAITRSNSAEMQALTENARMLGETTQFSATQAADAMSYLGMAGWNANQIIAGMPGLLALAAAGGTDLARTADIVSDDLTAFGLSADQAGHMADVFAVTVTRTNTNVEMLGETMKYAAPVAKRSALPWKKRPPWLAHGQQRHQGKPGRHSTAVGLPALGRTTKTGDTGHGGTWHVHVGHHGAAAGDESGAGIAGHQHVRYQRAAKNVCHPDGTAG